MDYAWLQAEFPQLSWKFHEPLAAYTYFRTGGPADVLVTVTETKDLEAVAKLVRTKKVPLTVLGGASNILVSDKGVRGVVVQNKTQGITFRCLSEGKVQVECASGVLTNLLAREVVNHELDGLQYFLGIPGTVGGAVFNNSHYNDRLFSSVISELDVLSFKGEAKTYKAEELEFAYDYSKLQKTKDVVLRVRFLLSPGVKSELEEQLLEATRKRSSTQPLGEPSSGCMFQNVEMPDGTKKGAGYLIDQAGLKGLRIGAAEVSTVHANFILNKGGATSADVQALTRKVAQEVQTKFGVKLKTEVFFLGEW